MNVHPTPCSGCPRCNGELARAMRMNATDYADWLNARQPGIRHNAAHRTVVVSLGDYSGQGLPRRPTPKAAPAPPSITAPEAGLRRMPNPPEPTSVNRNGVPNPPSIGSKAMQDYVRDVKSVVTNTNKGDHSK